MARKNNIPELVVDFIRTHHGTSLIRFFYSKAQKNAEKEVEIPEEDFRYDGPTPFTKEQGVLLLADSVEAASRAMKNPNYNKLETLIDRITDDHISERQLDNCPLTFRHIQIIKETFLSILVGVYHSRVEYPDDKELKSKKMARKKEQQTGADQTNRPADRQQENGANDQKKEDVNQDKNQEHQKSEDQKQIDS
jgi:membrane-associated HD superfamily phosphohydrolase